MKRAKERFGLQDYHGAIHCLEEVIASGRAYADAYHVLGLSFSFVKQPRKALQHLDEALDLNPRYVEAHLHRAVVLNELGREEEAQQAFKQAQSVAGEPRDGLPAHLASRLANKHAELGEAYAEAGAVDRAINEFNQAIALGPRFYDLRCRLARLLMEAGRALDAREHLELVVREQPNFAEASASLGLACYLSGDGLAAKAVWEEYLRRRPGDTRVQGYLHMLERAGRVAQ